MATSVKANRINVKDLVYCILSSDVSGTTPVYGTVKPLAKAMQIQITPAVAAGTLYGDGVQQEKISKLTGLTVAFDVNKIPIEAKAELLGHTFTNGILHEKASDFPPYVAIGYKVEQTGGKQELVWLLKGSAQPNNETVQQNTESINFSTDSITFDFIPREYDGELRWYGDTANADLSTSSVTNWFSQGPATVPT